MADPRSRPHSRQGLPVLRSAPASGTGNTSLRFGAINARQQMNALTAFIDLGQVYGADDVKARSLRSLTDNKGLMRVNTMFNDSCRELLPFSSMESNICTNRARLTNDSSATDVPCFVAGEQTIRNTYFFTCI